MQTVDISKARVFWGPIELTPASGETIDFNNTDDIDFSGRVDMHDVDCGPEFELPPVVKAPRQPNQHHRFYCMLSAADAGEHRHPQQVVRGLSEMHGFTVLGAVPQSLFDGWDFWIEYDANGDYDDSTEPPAFPAYFRAASWKPINQP